jgi:hypothetical protein
MNIELIPYKILIYYDIPELFVAKDNVSTNYLCLKTQDQNSPMYVTIPISDKKLNLIQAGLLELRDAFINSENGYWLLASFDEKELLFAEKIAWALIPEEFLPNAGFFFQKQEDYGSTILEESNAKYNTIVHLALTDQPGEQSVNVNTLADFIKIFQNLIKYTYKKEISQLKKNVREVLDQANNYTLRAFASTPGSFNIHLESTSHPNLFGENDIERALEKIDLMFFEYTSDQEIINTLRGFKGHSVSSLKRLLEIILRDSLHFEYKWISQKDTKIRKSSIKSVYASKIVDLLQSKNDLSQEIKEFIGYVHQADIDRGNWRIFNIDDEKEYSGISEHVKLDGITLETIKYRFICEEIIEEYKVSGKEETKYKLMSIETIN